MMEQWSSRTGFLLAAIGSAVGIGNIWRFSAVVGQNGGGAYLIPYLFACVLCALPLMILEMAAGRAFQGDVVSVFRSTVRHGNILGWLICAVVFFILCYYLVITGWTLAFVFFSAAGMPENFSAFTSSYQPLVFFVICALVTGATVSLGVKRGIERASWVLVPFIFLILAGMALFATTLPGFDAGIRYFLSADFSVLASPATWSAALGQAFFSLSVGQGILITYGAYAGKKIDLVQSAVIVMVADISASMLAGLVIFPVVFSSGLSPSIGAELAFVTLPKAFLGMPYGYFVAIAFFSLLFVAALTSAISILEVNIAAFLGVTRLSRGKICAVLTLLAILIGMPAALSYSALDLSVAGARVLDLMDEIFGTTGLLLTAIITSLALSWCAGRDRIRNEMGKGKKIPGLVLWVCQWVIPSLLTFALAFRIATNADFPDWHMLPGTPFFCATTLVAVSGIVIGILLLVILIFCRWRGDRCPWKRWLR
jgi:NSS family neurotransmitter:Na+ symporter